MLPLFQRELRNYFDTPVAYVFMVTFLLLSGMLTFFLTGWYELGKANLEPFFGWHPWLYLFLVPAISMRLWAEERRVGTLELLLTLPIPTWQLVLAKFLAAWAFMNITLVLTFPLWLTANLLGSPDNGVILAGYFASSVMCASYIAIGAALSAITRNQVIAFVLSVAVCFIFTASGFSVVINFFSGWLPQSAVDLISSFSFLTHFDVMARGLVGVNSILYFASLTALSLFANYVIVENKR